MSKKLNNVAGSCLCGSVKYQVFGEVDAFYLCHCSRCRRSTGTAHVANIFTQPENIEWLAGEELIRRYELPEAKSFAKQFCANCGSGVPYVNRAGTKLVIPAGGLTEPIAFAPNDIIFWESRAEWYEQGMKVPKHDGPLQP